MVDINFITLPTDMVGKTILNCIWFKDEIELIFTDGTHCRIILVKCSEYFDESCPITGLDFFS
mgnify:CR=1 FL=1